MRIVEGEWADRTLLSPSGRVRPTAEAVRCACVEMLGERLRGARFLDLFAGSGGVGLEALSRGARSCDFVEHDPAALHALKGNVTMLRARPRSRIFKRDAIPFAEALEEDAYDIAFADPPYGSRKLDRVVARWLEVPFSRVLILEHQPDHVLPVAGRRRRVGEAMLTLLVRTGSPAQRSTRR